ncbi:MAG: ABC transporter ATP-binding protein [Rhizobiales bacterium]|nr:ABC transporter ATP-binding protein [Rhizobacter sp.]
MLQAKGLTKRYGGTTALDSLDLDIAPGEVFCMLGANGAGKTTTINLFLDFTQPSSGSAWIDGLEVAAHPVDSKRRVAYIPEQVVLYKNLSGIENLAYFTELGGRGKPGREALLGALSEAGLDPSAADKRVGAYSKGMRQKVGIAIALAKGAKALLLDEPTSGLDPKASNEFSQILTRMSASGVAILMATHDLFRAKESGTRIGIMRQGKLLQTLAAADIGHAELEQLYLEQMSN